MVFEYPTIPASFYVFNPVSIRSSFSLPLINPSLSSFLIVIPVSIIGMRPLLVPYILIPEYFVRFFENLERFFNSPHGLSLTAS